VVGGGVQVDGSVGPPGRDQQFQVRQPGEQGAVEPGPLAHRHHHVSAVQRGHQVVAVQVLADGDPFRASRLAVQRVVRH